MAAHTPPTTRAPSPAALRDLICPRCTHAALQIAAGSVDCLNCGAGYPLVDGIPIMIDEDRSIFSRADFTGQRSLFFDLSAFGRLKGRIAALVPSMDRNPAAARNYSLLERTMRAERPRSRVLMLGASIEGAGSGPFLRSPALEIVESDVSFGPRTLIVLDAHAIPYADCSFDCVVAQAVLEHVVDPQRCVAEIHRVLRPGGLVYAETPFMQQVHGGPYDFTRFTRSGHRRLFAHFDELASGMTGGPGTAFAWSYQYLLLSIFGYGERARLVVKTLARVSGFWLKYLDHLAAPNPRAIDAASGIYFIGRRSAATFGAQELIDYYAAQKPGQ